MAGKFSDNDEEITDINVTPLVDVMLVLLVIFMVTASYITNQSIDVKLPSADTGGTSQKSLNLAFVVDKQSNLYLDGKAVALEQLPVLLKPYAERDPRPQAIIAADEQAPHGAVIKLIDMIRKNGINDFAINVQGTP